MPRTNESGKPRPYRLRRRFKDGPIRQVSYADRSARWREAKGYAECGWFVEVFDVNAEGAPIEKTRSVVPSLREALETVLPWIGVSEGRRGNWCPPGVKEAARAALERHP